jgi:hypothetical protein
MWQFIAESFHGVYFCRQPIVNSKLENGHTTLDPDD